MSENINLQNLQDGKNGQKQVVVVQPDDDYAKEGDGLVEAKYMGTVADRREMSALGKQQVLRVSRNHNFYLLHVLCWMDAV